MPLPQFAFSNTVSRETAKQDHIQVTFGTWLLRGSTETIDAIRHYMGAPPESARHGNAQAVMEVWGRLFDRPQLQGAIRRPLNIRSGSLQIGGEIIPPPLFSGSWRFNHYVHTDSTTRPVRTKLRLHLNPTRYVRYQSPTPLPSASNENQWPDPILYAHRGSPEMSGEAVLNNNDNWLSQTARWAAFTNPARWKQHLRAYLEGVTKELGRELNRISANTHHIEWEPETKTFSLQSTETYWEFSSENPIALVESLEPLLRAFSARACEVTNYPSSPSSGVFHNALCLKAQAGAGREIRIYAKTNRRIRIEVVHYLRSPNGFVLEGGKTGYWHELQGKLENLAGDAATLVNQMLERFYAMNDVTPSHICAYQLLMEIVRHSRDFPTATTIASALIHHNRVAAEGVGEKMQRALQRLGGAGILEYSAQRKVYVVTAPRRHALRMLKDHGSFPLLIARVRRRVSH